MNLFFHFIKMDDLTLGIGGEVPLVITPELSDLIMSHTQYISGLNFWEKYLVWRYTMGSGQVNRLLLGTVQLEDFIYWTYQFFLYYNVDHYGIDQISAPFQQWQNLFISPDLYLNYSIDQQILIAEQVITLFIRELERIILNAPVTTGEITVYKVSTRYSELPTGRVSSDVIVFQKPFNSTTYDPQLNFAPFLPEDSDCCLFVITIPAGARVLAIPQMFHAYPHEREILLPFNSSFDIYRVERDILDYVPANEYQFIQVQRPPFVIGEVYQVNQLSCPRVRSKPMTVYFARLIPPRKI